MPRGRLARAVKDLLEAEGGDIEERRRVAGELASVLRTCVIRVDHPLLKKLDKFTPKIGYPARWRDYSALQIDAGDLYGNYRRGYALEYDRDLAKLGGPVDRDEWFMTPQTVNA